MLDTDLLAKPTATAIASGLVISALIDTLISKGILSTDEADSILQRAMEGLRDSLTPEATQASTVIASFMRHLAANR